MSHSDEWPPNHGWWCDKSTWTCVPMNGVAEGIYNTKEGCERVCIEPPSPGPNTPGYICRQSGVDLTYYECVKVADGATYKDLRACNARCGSPHPTGTTPRPVPEDRGSNDFPAFAPPTTPQGHGSIQKWACNVRDLVCTKDPNGIYNTLADCVRVCQEPSTRIIERRPIIPTRSAKPVQEDRIPTPLPTTPRGGVGDRITVPTRPLRKPPPTRPPGTPRPTRPLKP